MDSKRFVEYTHVLRDRYLEQLAKLPWREIVRSRGASFDSLRNVFLHTLDAEDLMINYVIPGREAGSHRPWSRSPEEFHDMASIRNRAQEVESKTEAYLARMTPAELERKVEYSRKGVPPASVRVEDVLIHLAFENVHHFGELIALLWQVDVEPPHMGWIAYLQK